MKPQTLLKMIKTQYLAIVGRPQVVEGLARIANNVLSNDSIGCPLTNTDREMHEGISVAVV